MNVLAGRGDESVSGWTHNQPSHIINTKEWSLYHVKAHRRKYIDWGYNCRLQKTSGPYPAAPEKKERNSLPLTESAKIKRTAAPTTKVVRMGPTLLK